MSHIVSFAVALAVVAYLLNQVRKPSKWLGRPFLRSMNERHSAVTDWGLMSGRVTDAATGQPVAEVVVEAEQQINEPGASWYLSGPVTRSAPDGSYQLRLPPGKWTVYPFPPSPAWILLRVCAW